MRPTLPLRNIQVLRALAAVSVVVQHALHETVSLSGGSSPGTSGSASPNFGLGVNIFFVISGFIMAHASARDFGRPGASFQFLVRRILRIVPLYWLLTTMLLAGAVAMPTLLNVPVGDGAHILASYLFVPDARLPGEIRPVLALGWTLNYEMYFYGLFAVALLLPLRSGILALGSAILVLASIGAIVRPAQTQIAYWTDPIILDFLFGIGIALMRRAGWRLGGLETVAVATLGLAGFALPWLLPDARPVDPSALAAGVTASALVLAAALGPSVSAGWLTSCGVALGDASYSLYLVHPFVIRPLRALWHAPFAGFASNVALVTVGCLASCLVALVIYRLVERPMTIVLLRRWRPSGSSSAPRQDDEAAPLSAAIEARGAARRRHPHAAPSASVPKGVQ